MQVLQKARPGRPSTKSLQLENQSRSSASGRQRQTLHIRTRNGGGSRRNRGRGRKQHQQPVGTPELRMGIHAGSGFLLTGGTAPRCDRRAGNIVFVNEVQCNKNVPTISINVMGNHKAEYRPFINVTTQNVMGTWLYDTGVSVSCMSLEQFRRIAVNQRPTKQNPQIRLLSAAKTEINVIGLFHLKIKILDKIFQHPVHVCHPMNQSGIIGMDIIKRLGLTYLPAR